LPTRDILFAVIDVIKIKSLKFRDIIPD